MFYLRMALPTILRTASRLYANVTIRSILHNEMTVYEYHVRHRPLPKVLFHTTFQESVLLPSSRESKLDNKSH